MSAELNSLDPKEFMELDQTEGVSIVWARQKPFFFVLPDGFVGASWGIFVLVLVLLQAITVPLDAAFNFQILGFGEYLVLACFIMDIGVNSVQPFPDADGNLVLDFKRIANHYIYSPWFTFDVLSCIPFEFLAPDAKNVSAIKTLKIFRLLRVSKAFKKIAKGAKSTGASLQVWHARARGDRAASRRFSLVVMSVSL